MPEISTQTGTGTTIEIIGTVARSIDSSAINQFFGVTKHITVHRTRIFRINGRDET